MKEMHGSNIALSFSGQDNSRQNTAAARCLCRTYQKMLNPLFMGAQSRPSLSRFDLLSGSVPGSSSGKF